MTLSGPTRWFAATLVVVAAGLGYGLNGYPLLDPDEGRNAEIAREMAATNNYVVPRLNGLPYVDKPVLYFAAGAASITLFGVNEFAVRLPSLLATLATLAVIAWFGTVTIGRTGGLLAAAATGATPLTLAFARTVIFDSTLTLFVVLAIVGFYQAAEVARSENPGRQAGWTTAAWAAIALGVLTKGPIALAIPLMVAVPYLAWRRRLDALWDAVAVLLAVAIVLPWVALMAREVPDFVRYVVVVETVQRLFTDQLRRSEPWWYFVPILFTGALPWSLVAAAAWRSGRPARDAQGRWDRRLVLAVLWIAVPLVFFSLSQSKRPQYMVPVVPGIGLLAALLWSRRPDRLPGAVAAGAGLAVLGAVLAAAPRIVPRLLDVDAAVSAAIPSAAYALGLLSVAAGAGLAWLGTRRDPRPHVAALLLAVPVAAIPVAGARLMDAIGADRSARALADAVGPSLDPTTQVVAIRAYPLSLPFYLQRPLLVATADASELTSNFLTRTYDRWADDPASGLRPPRWWMEVAADCRRPTVFVARSDDLDVRNGLRGRVPIIVGTGRWVAFGPCGVTDLAHAPRLLRGG